MSFLWGGQFPGTGIIIPRFFIIHVLIIPLVLIGLLGAHLGLLVRQKHTQFPGEGRTEHNVVGSPMFPTFMAKTTGFLFMVAGVTALLGAFAQINPIWQFGSYDPSKISYAVQPDWYMGMARRRPAHHAVVGVRRVRATPSPWRCSCPPSCSPASSSPSVFLWPVMERKFTGDNEMHNLLDRPRDRPKRTAAGVAMFALLFTLFAASSTDVLANYFHVSLNVVLWFFRIAVIVVPIIAGLRHLPDLPGDAGRARRRQAQAGRRRPPLGRGRVHHGAHAAPARRRARRAQARAGAGPYRHRAAERWRSSPARELPDGGAPGHPLNPGRVRAGPG